MTKVGVLAGSAELAKLGSQHVASTHSSLLCPSFHALSTIYPQIVVIMVCTFGPHPVTHLSGFPHI